MKICLVHFFSILVPFCQGLAKDWEELNVTLEHRELCEAAKHAIYNENKALLDALIKAGLEINKPLDPDSGETALHYAASFSKSAMLHHLRTLGADLLAFDAYGRLPIEELALRADETVLSNCLSALNRDLTDYDQVLLMDFPQPVWRTILGRPERPSDPLAPPTSETKKFALVTFISVNGKDPTAPMKHVFDAHYPGWHPASVIEYAEPPEEAKPSVIRDKTTKEFGEHIDITLAKCTSNAVKANTQNTLEKLVQSQNLPAVEYKIRRTFGGALNGGGWGGHVVLLNGYWIKVGNYSWDE